MSQRYVFKVYADEQILGVLPDATNDFQITQSINTGGAQIEIALVEFETDTQDVIATGKLLQNGGFYVVTEDGGRILLSEAQEAEDTITDLANRIKAWYYDDEDYVNGIQIFDGLITSVKKNHKNVITTLVADSWGVQLDNRIIELLAETDIRVGPALDPNPSTGDFYIGSSSAQYWCQPFTVASQSIVNKCAFVIFSTTADPILGGGTAQIKVSLCTGTSTAPGAALASTTVTVGGDSTTTAYTDFVFSSPINLSAGSYVLFIEPIAGRAAIFLDATGYPVAGGGAALQLGSPTPLFTTDYNLLFSVTATTVLGAGFLNADPSDMVRDLIDNYQLSGGIVSYDGSSIDNTGASVDYTFKYNTVFQGIQKCAELAPSIYYWYVDIATNLLHFHPRSTTADHTFVRGIHVEDMEMNYSLDFMKNRVVYTGADVAGSTIISIREDQESIAQYGQWLSIESDNRVSVADTLDVLADNFILQNKNPRYSTVITIMASKYDIYSINPGDTGTFRNFDDVSDGLILQVVSMQRTPDKAVLTLDTLAPAQSRNVEQIRRDLELALTANVPDQ